MLAERKLVAAVGCQWRFHPWIERLHALLPSQGKVQRAEIEFSEYLPRWHPYEDYKESYAARHDLGGGVVLTQIHDYDLAHWLFGPARAVVATGGNGGSLGIDVEDTVRAQLDCERAPVLVRQTFAEQERKRSINVIWEDGSLTIPLLGGSVSGTIPGIVGFQLNDFDRNAMFRSVMEDFLHCVESGGTPRCPIADGVAVLRVALAVKESMRRRVPVSVQ